MKRLIIIACVGLIGAIGIAFAAKLGPNPTVDQKSDAAVHPLGRLVVHEWGTFTGFAGSDGVHLPFNTVLRSDLPAFVVNRQQQALRLDPKQVLPLMFIKGGGLAALVRMETPVIYFYADGTGDMNVRVDFPQGTLTEFYPHVKNMGPRYGLGFGEPGVIVPTPDAKAPTPESFLDWGSVRIIPHPSSDQARLMPAVADGSRYSFARNTDAALVQTKDADGSLHTEKFLFYRGLGNFTLPVKLLAHGADHFEIKNGSSSPITSAFLIQIEGDAEKSLRFARLENVAGNQQLTLPSASQTHAELADAIATSLVADGLYEKEARAMVQTWKPSWLDEPGTRVLYIVPRPVTDSLLPLHLSPAPDQTVRVLIGRIDVLTPERESQIGAMTPKADVATTLSDEDAQTLIGLGRFLDPAIQRSVKVAGGTHEVSRLYEALSNWQAKHQ